MVQLSLCLKDAVKIHPGPSIQLVVVAASRKTITLRRSQTRIKYRMLAVYRLLIFWSETGEDGGEET